MSLPSVILHPSLIVGIIEIVAGVVVVYRFTKLGAYVVSAWLSLIALSLIISGHYLDVAVRDVVMAVGAHSLGVLSGELEESRSQAPSYTARHLPAST